MISIQTNETAIWSELVHQLCGIKIDHSRAYLYETRLFQLFRETGTSSFEELYSKVKHNKCGTLQKKVVDLITTGETSFFRDLGIFELLKSRILPELKATSRPLKIWSTACSTGQEAYSIAIALCEYCGSRFFSKTKILATDISESAIFRASKGIYNQFEINRGLSSERLSSWFLPHCDYWKVRDKIRQIVSFRKMNLTGAISFNKKFDLVFCRNVAIYFSEEDKKNLFQKIAKVISPGGILVLGSTESLLGLSADSFEPVRAYPKGIYYRRL
ncbi:MAG: protein-glutamate O-methyltransferase CheR [Candidatus Riflebacteria bacterium]|nr:protein-glutamate O-methyltransferase CheR [Candidatus Riflebacteria bacterium]